MDKWTDCEIANNNFTFSIDCINMQLEELKVYLKEVHSFITITNENLQSDNKQNLDSETLENLKYHFQHTQGEILRKSVIISIIILLESEIDFYCKNFKLHKKLSIGYNDFKGDLLDKFKLFSSKVLLSDFDFQGILWQDIVGLYEIRNSLIHNRGFVSEFGKRSVIENFIKRNISFEIDIDEKICVSYQACIESIKIIETFLKEINDFALKVFPPAATRCAPHS